MKQEKNPVYIQLVLCEHIYPVKFIDEYMKSRPMESVQGLVLRVAAMDMCTLYPSLW